MEVDQNETIETLARRYFLKNGSNYLTVLSDMKKRGFDEETTAQVFEQYEILRSNRVDRKTKLIRAKEDNRLKIEKEALDTNKIIAAILGFIPFEFIIHCFL